MSNASPAAPPASDRQPEQWDLVIQPRRSLFDLHLDDLWRYRDLVYLFVRRDFVAQFKQTVLGPAWFVINPLLTTVVFTVVFGNIAKLSTDGLPPMIFYLSGNIVWQYFSDCLLKTSSTFTANAGIFGKVYFPRLAVPVSLVISGLIKFFLQLVFFLGFWTWFSLQGAPIDLTAAALALPLLILLMAGMSLGLGIIFSSMTTKYRDLTFLLGFGVRLAMYGTPVIFPLSSVDEEYRWILLANPMTPVIEAFRAGFLGQGMFDPGLLAYSAGFTAAVLLLGIVIFNRVEKSFMDTV